MADEELDKKAAKAAAKEAKKAEKAAKKRDKQGDSDENDDEEGGGFITILVGIIIIAVWLAIFALLIKMDVGGFGSTVLYPILKDVPYVNQILPEVDSDIVDDGYNYATVDEAVERIKELERELEEAKNNTDSNSSYIQELEAQSNELAEYKIKEAEFEEIREKFYEEVVFSDKAPDINTYKSYYESIEPSSAAAIYKSVVEQVQEDEDLEEYVKAYSTMKPKQAAAIFDTMTDDLMLVGKILWGMKPDARGEILGNMDTEVAAAVTKLMEP